MSSSALIALALLAGSASPQAVAPAPAVNGVWMSRGYGYVVNVKPEGVTVYDVAGEQCWPDPTVGQAMTGSFALIDPSARVAAYRQGRSERGILLDRLEALPAACEARSAVTSGVVLDAFWSTMREQYAFFDLHGIDWAARRPAADAAISADAGDRALFDALADAMTGLDDPHLTLSGQVEGQAMRKTYSRPPTFAHLRTELDARNLASSSSMTSSEFYRAWIEADAQDIWRALKGPRGRAFEGQLIWGRLDGGVGYIGLNTLQGFSASAATDDDVAALERELDRAMAALGDAPGMIVDLSQNLGGTDAAALAFAGRFADRRRHVYSKRVFNAPGLPEEAIFVAPAGPRTYLGPTVVLTSDVTMSAAEVLTLSLTAFPHVLHMGQSTRGGFSDVLVKTLPNGWRLTLSNEIYLTPDGRPVEGVGLEPASPLQVFPADRVWRNRLNVVREAASVLETRATPALYDTATGAPDV